MFLYSARQRGAAIMGVAASRQAKIVGSFLVRGIGGGTVIDFHEHKTRGVIGLLHDIEAHHARFPAAGAGVGYGGGDERRDGFPASPGYG